MCQQVESTCDICDTPIILEYCCDGGQIWNENVCGCMGLPINPPICSKKCEELYFLREQIKSRTFNKIKINVSDDLPF